MSVTVVCGGQYAGVSELSESALASGVEPPVCNVGRGSPMLPVDVRLGISDHLSRRAAQIRCIDGSWWQIRQIGRNGIVVETERGVMIPVGFDWVDVPSRFGVSYVTVTTISEVFQFKVAPDDEHTAVVGDAESQRRHSNTHDDRETRVVSKVGYWRVAVALCEPWWRHRSETLPTNPEIAARLDRLGLETEGFSAKAVEKRIKYLYEVTGVDPGDRVGLRRRLVDAAIVNRDDVTDLLRSL